MNQNTSVSWKDYICDLPVLKNEVGWVATGLNSAKNTVWLEIKPISSARYFIDQISQRMGRNINALLVKKDIFDEDVLKFDYDVLRDDFPKLFVKRGMKLSDLILNMREIEYERVKRVWEEGEYSIIGDSMTLWCKGKRFPFRIDFEDDKVQNINLIDSESKKKISDVLDFELINDQELEIFDLYSTQNDFHDNFDIPLVVSEKTYMKDEISYPFVHISLDIKSTKWDYGLVKKRIDEEWKIIFVINHNIQNAEEIKRGLPGVCIFEEDLEEGFESKGMKLMVLTDHEMWGTVKISKFRHEKYSGLSLDEITPGDFVVHEDHGVAQYSGIKEEENQGVLQKYVELKYAQKDRLLVPLTQLKKITKYVGSGLKKPSLTRLSGGEWKRIKRRVTESVRKIALELLRLYAARDITKVSPISLLNGELKKFENDFEFVETEDQIQSINDVYDDLQKEIPMDRLLVGDVGFGKTEVAMRAAFLAVKNGKQVAVLAPTTVLVEQHYQVFKSRMEKYSINVAGLSRFLTKEQANEVVKNIKEGKMDIVIGTHRLLSKDVEYMNLGLLIIDEEQKFGVSQKEKIKNKKLDVHVLSMSATPIPRTLNMALSGVRDISVITTPPSGRIPIKNEIKKFNWDDVVEAIRKEVERKGQVYFVHNRVDSIGFVYEKLSKLLPEVKFAIGHGQLSSEQLSRVMREFNEGEHDVLICSTIIENGLDMPNVNTLIIDRAEMFGLSQLYQIRGRVGRGDRQAYAHFYYYGTGGQRVVKQASSEIEKGLVPTEGTGILWEQARQRLQAIEELESLGSGFEISQKDLEIRGSGNFLGKEQHGNVNAIGFSLYCRLLAEMVDKLRKNENVIVKQ
ncbi:MAG: DEAD/DEAH box helicase [bacterium]